MMMKIQACSSVFALPVCNQCELLKLRITCGNESMQLKIPVCPPNQADFTAGYKLPFPAESTVLEGDEALFRHLIWKDSLPVCTQEKDVPHPAFHFTPVHGWLNDPNGLFYRAGEWHLYFQHNPFSACWENMHWGHAVSRDLIHWEEHGIALHPDSVGTMYSGSAVIDRNNAAGYGKEKVLLYYTNCGYDGKGTQCLAVGDGETFEKIAKNPLIGNISGCCDRDPNPAYDAAAGVWRMAIYLGNEEKREFNLFASDDLIHWHKTDSYLIPGGRECPGIRTMKDTVSGSEKWIFTEANCFYRVGTVSRDGKVNMETESRQFFIGDAYAGQFFQNVPDGRSVFIAWIRMPGGAFRTWAGCMSLPLDVRLENGKLKLHPAVDVPSVPFHTDRETAFSAGNLELVFDPARGTISSGTKTWSVQEPGEPFSGKIVRDCGCVEYFDGKDRYAGAFFCAE